ncbi:FAD-dependent oxidoreductase [Nocardioides acrostichi]|uniref:FAD-dependent monooxygenase n=1 Tax=Nocardioides acrostichi TaxID=2784339 RepID=A0A930Y710_9ACTN|nr:NAD(P)/FAD-dependent oxidoreductase [Nocardioides acrostichi]MBF4162935.1 FAD-dependent monooxygenase [Nocardioides acrostichi]
MRVAVVGLGNAGATAACLLHDAGHHVEVIEQAADPRPVGAGIWLQAMGQRVLDHLGLLEPLRACSTVVDTIDIRRHDGHQLLTLGYDDLPGSTPALGVARGDLFSLLHDAVRARGIPVRTGVRVDDVTPTAAGAVVRVARREVGRYDLVVGADGSRSAVRGALGLARRDHPYRWGAWWAVVDDPEQVAGTRLLQTLRGTREYVGVLPTGRRRASLFVSVAVTALTGPAPDLDAWRAQCAGLLPGAEPLLHRVRELLPATYRDVVVRTPYRIGQGAAAVLIGDAAHAMSPQLGTGTSLALADAWSLAAALRTTSEAGGSEVGTALRRHAADRRAHVRWYQWWTRLMMPAFQSGLTPLAVPRDHLAPLVARPPWLRRQLVGTLCGDRTGPFGVWRAP